MQLLRFGILVSSTCDVSTSLADLSSLVVREVAVRIEQPGRLSLGSGPTSHATY